MAVWVADVEATQATHPTHCTEATEATETEKRLRAQVTGLEQQLRGTEARVRYSEIARETEKKRHEEEVCRLDAELANVSRGIKGSLYAKDQVAVECRQWRRKFEDLEDQQQQEQQQQGLNLVREMKGRSRWAPAKKYGVGKRERGQQKKAFTAIAQVAIVNAAWESKLVKFESEARDYVARTDDQLRSLHGAATALSDQNACLQQQVNANHGITHELAQQQVKDAVASTMLFADHKHEEAVKELKQAHSEELMAVKAGHEKESMKATSTVKAEADTARTQQREAAERAAKEESRLKKELGAQEAQLGELQAANAKTVGELQAANAHMLGQLQAKEEELNEAIEEIRSQREARNELWERYTRLRFDFDDLEKERNDLVHSVQGLDEAVDDMARDGERLIQRVEILEGENRVLHENLTELVRTSVLTGIDLQQSRRRADNLQQQVATLETADLTAAVSGMGVGAE